MCKIKMVSGNTTDCNFAWERIRPRVFVSPSGKSKVFHTPVATFLLVQCPHLLFVFNFRMPFRLDRVIYPWNCSFKFAIMIMCNTLRLQQSWTINNCVWSHAIIVTLHSGSYLNSVKPKRVHTASVCLFSSYLSRAKPCCLKVVTLFFQGRR